MAVPLDELLKAARAASQSAYCPYSKFPVGAAVLAGSRIFTGANIENASFGLTLCAERTAIFAAIIAGERTIDALALACVNAPTDAESNLRMPCGACRQVLAEFAGPETPVAVDGAGTTTLGVLLPLAFRLHGQSGR
ncbi:cytidine deaminase [Singulisphaera acidiphila]|uniref:Cytidine deaminase n=1 Tax=Singulisphaera acidiphila (strain ATCC BAA-1392 / DSM 18658 / VKM B-2454 / MOB10) TaxID=886293 RepID=L0DFK1_SINAD|nr:cytidine deaminase [Singulisphaera acidiphila]AGA27426.1 cytidine deaminase, homotetrameric [Singulisphaera acidiphila DSM 18658]